VETAQVIECLSSKHETQSSNASASKLKIKKKQKKNSTYNSQSSENKTQCSPKGKGISELAMKISHW
jgi:hypothetical protein